jgi:hypothetical protein
MLCTIANINHAQTRNNKQTLIKYLNIIGSKENLNFSHNLATVDLDDPDFLKHKTITVIFKEIKHTENKKQADFFDDCIWATSFSAEKFLQILIQLNFRRF